MEQDRAGQRHGGVRRERGSMAIEMVLLTPILVAIALLAVAGGRFVTFQGQVDGATRDAARAASLARDGASATAAARTAAAAVLPEGTICSQLGVDTSDFVAGGSVTVNVRCTVSYSGLGLLGLPGSTDVTSESVSPIDIYRRTG